MIENDYKEALGQPIVQGVVEGSWPQFGPIYGVDQLPLNRRFGEDRGRADRHLLILA